MGNGVHGLHSIMKLGCGVLLATQLSAACATDVALVGIFPGKALVVIDGGAPRALAPGQSVGDVKVVSVEQNSAMFDISGKRSKLVVGESPVSVGGGGGGGSDAKIVLTANSQGHFLTDGAINGSAVRFIVDTGATAIAMSPSVAIRAGISYTRGQRISLSTANGSSPGWLVKLDTVTVGGVTMHNLEGVVMSAEIPAVLLGNSFLNRMEMTRDGSTMTLRQRY